MYFAYPSLLTASVTCRIWSRGDINISSCIYWDISDYNVLPLAWATVSINSGNILLYCIVIYWSEISSAFICRTVTTLWQYLITCCNSKPWCEYTVAFSPFLSLSVVIQDNLFIWSSCQCISSANPSDLFRRQNRRIRNACGSTNRHSSVRTRQCASRCWSIGSSSGRETIGQRDRPTDSIIALKPPPHYVQRGLTMWRHNQLNKRSRDFHSVFHLHST